jgi:hypothetical protein
MEIGILIGSNVETNWLKRLLNIHHGKNDAYIGEALYFIREKTVL